MLKACTLIRRKPGMSVEDFQAYWRTTHADVVKKMPQIRRYVQSHPLMGGYRKGELAYDGVAEVWVDDSAALREMAASAAYKAVEADEANFIDRPSMALILTDEHVIKDGPVPVDGVKNIEFVTHKPGMEIAAFQEYWRGVHGPLAAKIPSIKRYVQSHTRLAGYQRGTPPAWDGLAITWFDSVDAMRAGASSQAYRDTRADEPNFIDEGKLSFIITREHVIVG
jgi:uncharacterized protein (TIGR02118 family)